ncbi:MAG: MATE family efflux transporter, partial [Firmicutes bacterium]|nr:MATE family efflux transporter [Bacillota bacterium]
MGNSLTLDINAERGYFFRKGIFIALPVMLQNLIAVGLNIIDSIMIGGLGEAAMAGVGSANQIYMIYSEVCFGTFSGAAVYVSQFWGIRDRSTVPFHIMKGVLLALLSVICVLPF